MKKYTGGNTVDPREASQIQARGSVLSILFKDGLKRGQVTHNPEKGTYDIPPHIIAQRKKLLNTLDSMPRRETP